MKKVLVVEDDKFYSNILSMRLQKAGNSVTVVDDGQKALEEVSKNKPDLILLDLVMPIKDGFETLEDLYKDPANKKIKVIVLTNLSQEEDKKRALDLGALDYIVKTNLSIQQMVDVVEKNLK